MSEGATAWADVSATVPKNTRNNRMLYSRNRQMNMVCADAADTDVN